MELEELPLQQQISLWRQEVAFLRERYKDRRGKTLPVPSDLFHAVEHLRQLEQQERMQQRMEQSN
jgi:hypothetical protein